MKVIVHAFDPQGFVPHDGAEGGSSAFAKAIAVAEKMKLRFDIQDDSFMVFFPDEQLVDFGSKAHMFMGTKDGRKWLFGLEDAKGNVYQLGDTPHPLSGHANLNAAVHRFVQTAKLSDRTETLALLFVAQVS